MKKLSTHTHILTAITFLVALSAYAAVVKQSIRLTVIVKPYVLSNVICMNTTGALFYQFAYSYSVCMCVCVCVCVYLEFLPIYNLNISLKG